MQQEDTFTSSQNKKKIVNQTWHSLVKKTRVESTVITKPAFSKDFASSFGAL